MIFLSSGKASELGGPLYAPIDRLLHSLRLGTLAEGFYNAQDPDSIVALDSFAKGFNHFAETHPEDFTGPVIFLFLFVFYFNYEKSFKLNSFFFFLFFLV